MKTVQTVIALLAIVGLIFGVAYLLQNYQGPTNPGPAPGVTSVSSGDLRLRFPEPTADLTADSGGQFEVNTEAHRDFWFSNPNNVPFKLGIESQTCKCSRVEAITRKAAAPEELQRWEDILASKEKGGPLEVFAQTAPGAKVERGEPKLEWVAMHRESTGTRDGSIAVEPHAAGLVRLFWKVQKPGPERLSATLWTQPQTGGPSSRDYPKLEVTFTGVGALYVDPPQVTVEDLMPREKRQLVFWCFSPTRAEFDLKAEVQKRDKSRDPCFVTSVRPMSAEERKETTERLKTGALHGYRVQVDVHERLDEKVQLDLGLFRRRLVLTTPIEPEAGADIGGVVRGEVSVGAGDERDRVPLGSFDSARGARKEVLLTVAEPGVQLEPKPFEIEPDYLQVKLVPDSVDASTWRLRVVVPPNAAQGNIRGQVMIRVQTPGNPPRRIRIPVMGTAFN